MRSISSAGRPKAAVDANKDVNFQQGVGCHLKCNTVPSGTSLTVSSTWTPTAAMPSAFYWPLLVPCALRAPAPVNSFVRLLPAHLAKASSEIRLHMTVLVSIYARRELSNPKT